VISKLFLPAGLFVLILALTAVHARGAQAEAPDFSAPDLSGKVQTLSSYRGRIVVLNFWATWCPECVRELPSLSAFAAANKDVAVLGVTSDRNPETVRTFLSSRPVAYPVLVDTSGEIFVRKYKVRVLPCTVIVDRRGNIAERIFGAEDFQSSRFRKKIERLKTAP
jgi:cytochrome c-type biogenesis protein